MTESGQADGDEGPDALELEVFRYAVEAVVDELDANIIRTAHSPLVYETKDYSVGLLTRDFRLLGQSKCNLPIFIADLGEPVRDAVEVIGEDRLAPGDRRLRHGPYPLARCRRTRARIGELVGEAHPA